MKNSSIVFSSPRLAKDVVKIFGNDTQTVEVRMRSDKDVSQFIRKIENAYKKTSKSRLIFA
jgi:hypothetical protein